MSRAFLKASLAAAIILGAARPSTAADTITFNNQVVRIFQQHCQTCHRPGNIAPFSLLTYAEIRTRVTQIRRAVESREMPPWKPVNPPGTFEAERLLSAEEIDTIVKWADAGAPEGAPNDLPAPVTFPDTWNAGQPDMVLRPPEAYPLQPDSADIYRCFSLPADPTADLYVRGYEIIPGNRSVVHHIILFTDENGESLALDNADPEPGYSCFGGAGFTLGIGGLGAWAPGASPLMFPLGTGIRVAKGSRIVMQVHYSTLDASASGAPLTPDRTSLGLYLSPVPLTRVTILPIVNFLFLIPKGASNHEVHAFLPIPTDVELVSVAPHMHLLGRDASVTARFPNGQTRDLIEIDDWDFHWQGIYTFREPIVLPAGTILEMVAHYDNSTNNPRNPTNPPVDVRWGERTIDEMCLTFISVKPIGTPAISTVPFSVSDRGTSSVVTTGGTGGPQTGYARVGGSSGTTTSGLAIFGYRQNGILISEAGVPASPLIVQGRIAAEAGSAARTGLAIANPNSTPATLSFYFTDVDGREVVTRSATVPANGQIAAFLDESPFMGPTSFAGSFSFTSSTPISVTALRGASNERGEFLLTTLPVVNLSVPPASGPALFAHFADGGGWTTQITLVNPTSAAITGTLKFRNPLGQQMGPAIDYALSPKSARPISTDGTGVDTNVGSVLVSPGPGSATPAGSLVFTYRKGGVRVTEAGISLAPAATSFRLYVEASADVQSGIAIANPTSTAATVRLDLIDMNGATVASSSVIVGPESHSAGFLNQIPGFQLLRLPFKGQLRLSSPTPIVVTGLRGRNNERGDFLLAATPPVAENASSNPTDLFFPHFVDAGGYTTQFILFAGGSSLPISGNLRFFSQGGDALSLKLK